MEGYNREELYKKQVNLYMESNPNPNSLKFVANYMLVGQGQTFDYPDVQSARESPLAVELFNLPYVRRVFIMSNFVTVTKDPQSEWIEVQDEIKQLITQYLKSEKPIVITPEDQGEGPQEEQTKSGNHELEDRIKDILDEYIKPAVEMDGGAIQFHSFEDGVVKVLLQGACSGCPSSTITLKAGIENLLKRMVPEVQQVEAEGI